MLSSACESIRSTSGRNLSLYCHMVYGLLEERKENILTLSDIMSAGKDNKNYIIPDKRADVLDVLHSLHSIGLISVLESKRKVWVVVNKGILLTEVDGILFAPETFKEHVDIASNTGIVSVSDLNRLFPRYDPFMLICFLKNMELCKKLAQSFLRMTNLIAEDGEEEEGGSVSVRERLLFFPCLLSTYRPDEMTSQVYQFGWCLQCTSKHHFFPPLYFHVLSLHLAFKMTLPQQRNKLNRYCTFWKNGLYWFNGHGIGSLVEIVDESQCVLVMMSCEKGYSDNMVSLRRNVIGEVMSVYKESCPSLEVKELVIDPKELAYSVNTPRERTVYSVKDILSAIDKGDDCLVHDKGQTELKEILPDESLSDISNLSLLGGRDIKEVIGIKPEKIEKWLKEGTVELKVTRINMHGAPGAGKTCSQHLLLNEPPPEKLTDSTPIACRAVQATRISIDDENKKWERVEEQDLYDQLASHLKEAPIETKFEQKLDKASLDLDDIFDSSDEDESDDELYATETKPSIEQTPTEIKRTEINPTQTEVVQEVINVHEAGKSKKFSTNWVYFIDSGGQPAYRELLPLFTGAAALNIITIDLTKGLHEKKCEFHYRINQNTFPIKTKLQYSNLDIIRSTISSEAMFNPIKISFSKSDKPKPPHYLILGTRKELVTDERLKEMNRSLISSSNLDLKNVIPNEPGESIIFPVDTLLPAGSKEREEASVELWKLRRRNAVFLTKEEVIKIGEDQLLDESDIDDALQYLHDVTIILYYHEVLPNLVFVNPKPILGALSHLIAITYIDQSNLHLIAKVSNERIRLKECGLFKQDLLEKIGQKKIFDQDFESSHMITLLKHLHVIAEIGGDYFFPCALPSCDKLIPAPTEIQPLLIAWEINNSGTTTLAIPQGLFPLTIVHLLEREDVDFSPVGKDYYRYNDAMSLRVYKEYTIDIINHYTHIEIRFDGCKDFCPRTCKLVTEAIKKSSKNLNVNDDHIFAFKCSMDEQCYCIVQEDNLLPDVLNVDHTVKYYKEFKFSLAPPLRYQRRGGARLVQIIVGLSPGQGLGLSIVGGRGSPTGDVRIYVKRILPESVLQKDSKIKTGDELVAVNDLIIHNVTKDYATEALTNVQGAVRLLLIQDL
uniref:PDZ domain-containing protein n=1 Tax=Amphimedon queenslandica TaxID=400682 RepID=A0A1X7ULU0_AMPQE